MRARAWCWMVGLLAVWVPFPRVTRLLAELVGVEVSASSAWNWGQARGQQAMARLAEELKRLAHGERPAPEALAAEIAALPMILRKHGCRWREGAISTR
jgi:hypothetical protein